MATIKEYTFKFKNNDSYSPLETIFTAYNETEAYAIADHYMQDVLENKYNSAELVYTKIVQPF